MTATTRARSRISSARAGNRAYDAFVSYSHAADGRLAPALQRGLQSLAKPWYRRRALRVFRDETSLSASPELRFSAPPWPSSANQIRGHGARGSRGRACNPEGHDTPGQPALRTQGSGESGPRPCRHGILEGDVAGREDGRGNLLRQRSGRRSMRPRTRSLSFLMPPSRELRGTSADSPSQWHTRRGARV